MKDVSSSNLVINDVIVASQLHYYLFVLANFLILSNTLLFKYFLIYGYLEGNVYFANKMPQYDIIMTSY